MMNHSKDISEIRNSSENYFYVSCILNGPLCFAVQAKFNNEVAVPLLTYMVNSRTQEKFQEQILPNTMCLAVFSNNVLYRARVSSVSENSAIVCFIDFGSFGTVQLCDLYKIPDEFAKLQPLVIHVRLNGLTNELITPVARQRFVDLIEDQLIILDFTGQATAQTLYADIYLDNEDGTVTNIKDKMLIYDKPSRKSYCRHYPSYETRISNVNDGSTRSVKWQNLVKEDRKMAPREIVENVVVQHVASTEEVYVILTSHLNTLDCLMDDLREYGSIGKPKLCWENLSVGMPVCSFFSDRKWYRAEITGVLDDVGEVSVKYVDFGNYDEVFLKNLLKIPSKLSEVRPLVFKCKLDLQINTKKVNNIDLVRKLRSTIIGKEFRMHVVNLDAFEVPLVHLKTVDTGCWLTDLMETRFPCTSRSKLTIFNSEYPYIDTEVSPDNDSELERLETLKGRFNELLMDVEEAKLQVDEYLTSKCEDEEVGAIGKLIDQMNITKNLKTDFERPRKFIDPIYDDGCSLEVSISQFYNPSSFYVHITSRPFRELMQAIQYSYCKRQPLNKTDIKEGTDVIAKSGTEEDGGLLYRARVITLNGSNITIRLVDYGRVITCKYSEIWRIRRRHLKLQTAAIHCRMENLIPSCGVLNWDGIICDDIKKIYFNDNLLYRLNILERHLLSAVDDDDAVYHVQLLNLSSEEEEDISRLLIDDGYACIKISEEPIDLPLLIGQKVTVQLAEFISWSTFYVILETNKMELITSLLNEIPAKKLKCLSRNDVIEGMFCLAIVSRRLHRVVILSTVSELKVRVGYVDRGGDEILELHHLYIIPEYLLIYNGLAVECTLYNGGSFELNGCAPQNIPVNISIYVNGLVDDRLSVTVLKSEEEEILQMPVLRFIDTVTITSLTLIKEDDNDREELIAYVRPASMKSVLENLENSLNRYERDRFAAITDGEGGRGGGGGGDQSIYESTLIDFAGCLKVGMMCAVKCKPATNQWYRSRVLSMNYLKPAVTVRCVDYGSIVTVPLQLVHPLDAQFYRPSELCLEVRTGIYITPPQKKKEKKKNCQIIEDVIKKLKTAVNDVSFIVEFESNLRRGDIIKDRPWWRVNFHSDSSSLHDFASKYLNTFDCIKTNNDHHDDRGGTPPSAPNALLPVMEGSHLERWFNPAHQSYSVVNAESPFCFWIRRTEDDDEKCFQMEKYLETMIKSSPAVRCESYHYGLFAAEKHRCCGGGAGKTSLHGWCRAKVKQNKAFAIDRGGYEENLLSLKYLPYRFRRQLGYAIKCSLDIVPTTVDETDNNNHACERFKEFIAAAAADNVDTTTMPIELIFPNADNSEQIVRFSIEEYFQQQQPAVDVGDLLIDVKVAARKRHSVFVSHVDDLDEFYVQFVSRQNDLDTLDKLLNCPLCYPIVVDVSASLFQPGDVVAAKYEQRWYRAVVIFKDQDDNNNNRYLVEFIDYGNRSICCCDVMKRLPDRLGGIPRFAIKCHLSTKTKGVGKKLRSSSRSEKELFYERFRLEADTRQFTLERVTTVSSKQGQMMSVNLYVEEEEEEEEENAVQKHLVDFLNDCCFVDGDGTSVFITHINGVNSFYVLPTIAHDIVETFAEYNFSEQNLVAVNASSSLFNHRDDDSSMRYIARIDDNWRRVKLLDVVVNDDVKNSSSSSSSSSYLVFAIDYGYQKVVSRIYQMPDVLTKLGSLGQAIHCGLTTPKSMTNWPQLADEMFKRLYNPYIYSNVNGASSAVFTIKRITETEPYAVLLNDQKGVSVRDIIFHNALTTKF